MTLPKTINEEQFPLWHARSMGIEEGVGILTFDSINEMRASFVPSHDFSEVGDA